MGLREVLLLATVAAICIGSLFKPRLALYGYMWYALMRPDIFAFVQNKYPISLILAAATFVGAVRCAGGLSNIFRSRITLGMLALQLFLFLSYEFAVVQRLSEDRYSAYIKMIAVMFCVPVMIQTERQLRTFLLVIALSLGVVGVKFGLYGMVQGGVVLQGGFGDNLDDNNFLGLVLAMLVPLCWGLIATTRSRILRLCLAFVVLCSIMQVVMSNSRGSSIALGIGLLLIVLRSRRGFVGALALGLCAAAAIYLVRDTYFDRMGTLKAPEQEASAASRLVHASAAFDMWKDYPLLGVGFGGFNYAVLAPKYQPELDGEHVAHNTYLQMLVDSGIVAFFLYIWIIIAAIRLTGRWGARWSEKDRARSTLARGLQAALVMFAVGGAFYSCHRMEYPYMLLMAIASWDVMEKKLEEPEAEADAVEPAAAIA